MGDKPFLYTYGTDLHWLHGWAYRLGRMLADHEERTEYDWMIFRPCESADDAMMRYSIDYPAIIAELRTKLQSTNDAFSDYLERRDEKTASILSDWMEVLERRILKACELIAEREGIQPVIDATCKSNIRSRSRERDELEELIDSVDAPDISLAIRQSPTSCTYLPAQIYNAVKCSDRQLRKVAEAAGVSKLPAKKGDRYSHADYLLILNYIVDTATDQLHADNAKRLLAEQKAK